MRFRVPGGSRRFHGKRFPTPPASADKPFLPPHPTLFRFPRPGFPLDALSDPSLAFPTVDPATPRATSPPTAPFLITVDLKEIRKIVELMNEHGLTLFDMSKEGFQLKLRKGQDLDALRGLLGSLPAAPAPLAHAAVAPAAPVAAASPAAAPVEEGSAITSPMVGTFYRKPGPDSPAFASVGDVVSEGQTLCIIEAMKVMNEIKSEKSGTITAVLVEDGTPVQFGDALFRIK